MRPQAKDCDRGGFELKISVLCFLTVLFVRGFGFGVGVQAQQVPPTGGPVQHLPDQSPALPPDRLPNPFQQKAAPPVRLVSPGILEIDNVRIVKKERQIEIPCQINMVRGLLEYLIVARGGKTHESLLRTDSQPVSIQLALLLLGLEGSSNPLARQGDPKKPEGDPVTLWVQWEEDGQVRKDRIEKWVMLVPEGGSRMMPPPGTPKLPGTTMESTDWTFTGSFVAPDGVFSAQVQKSIVAIYHDPAAIIDNPLTEGANNRIWFVNEGETPPLGKEVTAIIRKAGD